MAKMKPTTGKLIKLFLQRHLTPERYCAREKPTQSNIMAFLSEYKANNDYNRNILALATFEFWTLKNSLQIPSMVEINKFLEESKLKTYA